jgi:hypothetical protein
MDELNSIEVIGVALDTMSRVIPAACPESYRVGLALGLVVGRLFVSKWWRTGFEMGMTGFKKSAATEGVAIDGAEGERYYYE